MNVENRHYRRRSRCLGKVFWEIPQLLYECCCGFSFFCFRKFHARGKGEFQGGPGVGRYPSWQLYGADVFTLAVVGFTVPMSSHWRWWVQPSLMRTRSPSFR